MKPCQLPPIDELLKLFVCDPAAGKLYNRVRRGKSAIGKEPGHADGLGYRRVRVGYKFYLYHRIIYKMATGDDPGDFQIDHINGDKSDNRIENLRLATASQNRHNVGVRSNNSIGVKGVSWCRRERKYRAAICKNGKQTGLGYFESIEAAAEAYRAAAEKLHGEFANFGGDAKL